MQGQEHIAQFDQKPLYRLTLDRDDITALLHEKDVRCTIPGQLNGKPIELMLWGAYNALMKPWFEACVQGKPPFYMVVPSHSEERLRRYLTSERFEIRTSYLGTSSAAHAQIEIQQS